MEDLAALARIELGEDEKKDLLADMQGILEYVKQIEEVKVDVQPSGLNNYNVWHEDKADAREFSKELIIGQFPDSQPARPNGRSGGDGIFLKVKKIL